MATLDALQQVFVSALGIPPETDFHSLAYRSVPQWDSVAHMALIARLEEQFSIMLDTDDVVDMSSFEICRQILTRHGVDFDD